ncbi:MAG: hypothetical protein J6X67_02360 [Treponema sp.]|nr:hypothetical protein [Treponema sp.]
MKKEILFGLVCVSAMLAIKFCSICNFLATCEAKWALTFVNRTNLENPELKVRIDGHYVTVKSGQNAFWGPYGDVEKIKTPRGTHAVVTDLSNSQTWLSIILCPEDEPPLPKMLVVSTEKAYLWKHDAGRYTGEVSFALLPRGTKVRPLKRGSIFTASVKPRSKEENFPNWVTDEALDDYVCIPWVKVEIPKEARKKWGLPRTAWLFGGDLSEVNEVKEK